MAQGDAYVYQWATNSSGTDSLTFTPSAGVEWMFVSSFANDNDIGLSARSSGDTATRIGQLATGYTTTHYAVYDTTGFLGASGGAGWNTGNMKIIATNSDPLRYFKSSASSTRYARFSAIVINE